MQRRIRLTSDELLDLREWSAILEIAKQSCRSSAFAEGHRNVPGHLQKLHRRRCRSYDLSDALLNRPTLDNRMTIGDLVLAVRNELAGSTPVAVVLVVVERPKKQQQLLSTELGQQLTCIRGR